MKTTNWKDIAELVGITAIVASLLFVGLQLKQSHEIALSEAYQQRSAMTSDAFFALSENEAARSAILGAIPSTLEAIPEGVDPDEFIAFQYWMMGMMMTIENTHYQYQIGFMPEEGWLRSRNSLKNQLRVNALTRPILQTAKPNMSQSFREEVEKIEAEVESE